MNAGVRAVANLPRYGYFNLTEVRSYFKIPSVDQVTEKVVLFAAWRNRNMFKELNSSLKGPSTRSRAKGNVPHPIQKGPLGKVSSTPITSGWNRLPLHIKSVENTATAKRLINKHVMSI